MTNYETNYDNRYRLKCSLNKLERTALRKYRRLQRNRREFARACEYWKGCYDKDVAAGENTEFSHKRARDLYHAFITVNERFIAFCDRINDAIDRQQPSTLLIDLHE